MNIVDDHTVQFILPEPYNYERVILAGMTLYPSHVFDGDPEALDNATTYYNTPGFVTSGPYTVTEINEDSFVCTARDDYYRGTPQVKTVVMKVIGSGSTREIAFENGEIDYMRLTTADQLEKYSAQSDKYNIYSFPEARLNYLQVNPFGPANLTDEQRQALFMAINPDEILAAAFGSDELATKANSLLTPEISLYNPDTEAYTYDLEGAQAEAKQLSDDLMDVAMDQYRIYPLTYTNYVLVSQKNVTGLDSSPIVPEFADYLGISVNG